MCVCVCVCAIHIALLPLGKAIIFPPPANAK